MDTELNKAQKSAIICLLEADGILQIMDDNDLAAFIREPQSEWTETLTELVAPYMPQS